MSAGPAPSRVAPADLARLAAVGLRTRRLRAVLAALGIAIGIAAMVAVLGVSESSRADLLAALDRLGTNLLEVEPGQSFLGEQAKLPLAADEMAGRIEGVNSVAAVGAVDATVRRSDRIPREETGGISVHAADPALARTLGARMARGRFLNAATRRFPVVVLGSTAAQRLGVDRPGRQVYLGGRWFTVAGVLRPVDLAPEFDTAALIGFPVARRLFGTADNASAIYVRAQPERLAAVRALLGRTANPERPEEVNVSRPSDAIAARAAAKATFTSLFLGLGAVALVVGGLGIANVMVISVLERRSEIGLRRALGATRRLIGIQFLSESLLLALLGGVAGAGAGAAVTAAYASSRGWETLVPAWALAGGAGAALAIGAVAGLYPALRAARLSPTEALRSQ